MDCFASLAMTQDIQPRSRDMICPSFALSFRPLSKQRAQGKPGGAAPAVSRAIVEKRRTRAYRFSGDTPAFPAQWLYGLYVLAPARPGFVVTAPARTLARTSRRDTNHWGVRSTRFHRPLRHVRLVYRSGHRIPPRVRDVRTPLNRVRWVNLYH